MSNKCASKHRKKKYKQNKKKKTSTSETKLDNLDCGHLLNYEYHFNSDFISTNQYDILSNSIEELVDNLNITDSNNKTDDYPIDNNNSNINKTDNSINHLNIDETNNNETDNYLINNEPNETNNYPINDKPNETKICPIDNETNNTKNYHEENTDDKFLFDTDLEMENSLIELKTENNILDNYNTEDNKLENKIENEKTKEKETSFWNYMIDKIVNFWN